MQFSIRTKAEALPSLINSAFSYLFNLPLILIPISSTSLQTSLPALEQPPGWFPRIHFPLSKLQARSSHSPSVAFQCLQAIYKRLNISLVFKVFTLPAHRFSCREATLLHSGRHRSHPSLCEWWLLEYCSTQPVRLNMVAWPLHRTLYSVLKAASLVHHLSLTLRFWISLFRIYYINCSNIIFIWLILLVLQICLDITYPMKLSLSRTTSQVWIRGFSKAYV